MAELVAKAYGDALFEIAIEENKSEVYREWIHVLKETMDKRFIQILSHPRISKEEKKKCVDDVYGKQFDTIFIHFLKVLIDKNRFQYILSICDEFDLNFVKYFNIIQAKVCSARALSDDEKDRLKDKLEKKYQCNIECIYRIDPSLLAGIRVQVKDQVMDNTALNRLTKMKNSITS